MDRAPQNGTYALSLCRYTERSLHESMVRSYHSWLYAASSYGPES